MATSMKRYSQKHAYGKKSHTRSFLFILIGIAAAAVLINWSALKWSESTRPQLLGVGVIYQDLPGLDLAAIPAADRPAVLARLHHEECPCGCKMTVAYCRHEDPKCQTSLAVCRRIAGSLPQSEVNAPASSLKK